MKYEHYMNYFILAGLCSQQYDWKGIIQYVLFSCFKSVLSFLCCFHFLWGNRQFSHLIINSWLSLHIWNQDCSCLSRRILMVWFPKCAGGHCCDNLMAGNDLDSVYKRGQSHRVPLAHIHFAAATDGCLPRSEWGGNLFTWFRIPGMPSQRPDPGEKVGNLKDVICLFLSCRVWQLMPSGGCVSRSRRGAT